MTPKISAIIFDMDGTLVSSSQVIFEGYQYALAPWGINLSKEEIESIRAKKAEDLFSDWGLNHQESLAAVNRMNEYCQSHALRSSLFDGIKEMLTQLHRNSLPMAIWTGRNTQAAIDLLSKHGIDHFFNPIIGSSCVKKNKPHPEGILTISNIWQIPVTQILMIGDHDHDVEAGKAAACLTARALWRERNHSHQQEEKSDWEFTHPRQLINLVENQR